MGMTVWITGTGTGVGKTVLTALLTTHLRGRGIHTLAVKPYASGSLEDAELLEQANEFEMTKEQISPVYCAKPLAPLAGLSEKAAVEGVQTVLEMLQTTQSRCEVLITEGIGGSAVPVAPGLTVGHLMGETATRQLVVGQNRLGIINDILLTNSYLSGLGKQAKLNVLMEPQTVDPSVSGNARILKEVLRVSLIIQIPWLGGEASDGSCLKENAKKIRKSLDHIWEWINVSTS